MPPTNDDADQGEKLLIHLNSGQTIDTYVDGIEDSTDLFELISGPPRWRTIGEDVVVFTQAVAGLELG